MIADLRAAPNPVLPGYRATSACLRHDRGPLRWSASVLCCADNDPAVADDDAVSCLDLQDWSTEFDYLTDRTSLFVRPKSRAHARQYLGCSGSSTSRPGMPTSALKVERASRTTIGYCYKLISYSPADLVPADRAANRGVVRH